MLLVGVREYTCILFNFFILNGTTWGSGKKGGQGWGETLVITIVVQGAGYYPHRCMPGPSAPGGESP